LRAPAGILLANTGKIQIISTVTAIRLAGVPKEYLKISKFTLYKLAQENKLPGQKIGKRWRFHKDAVDEWLKVSPEPKRAGVGN
jgi:excisionase family DNA binding protein